MSKHSMPDGMASLFYFYYDLLLKAELPLIGNGYLATYSHLSKGTQKRNNGKVKRQVIYIGHTWFDHMQDCYPLSKLEVYLSPDSTKVYFRLRGSNGLWPEALGLRLAASPDNDCGELFLVGHNRTEAYYPRWQGGIVPARQWLNFKKEISINLADYQQVIHEIIKIIVNEPNSLKIWKEANKKAFDIHSSPKYKEFYE